MMQNTTESEPHSELVHWFLESFFNQPIETISQLIIENGFITSFCAVVLLLGYQYFNRRIKSLQVCSETAFMKHSPLEHHKLFETCDYWLHMGIRRIEFPVDFPVRAKLYEHLLAALIKSVEDTCKSRISVLRNAKDPYVWRDEARETLTAIVLGYEVEFKHQGTPEIVIKKFRIWHQGSLDYVLHNIESLGDSTIANTDHKTAALFSAILSSTKTAFYDVERTLITLNGELSGQEYQGKVIE